jgi:DNA-binding transcriptional LysR family regulator
MGRARPIPKYYAQIHPKSNTYFLRIHRKTMYNLCRLHGTVKQKAERTMELRQLRYFVTVAEERHFARAAARLHIAQQSLSFQIKQLEQELETTLFERTTRRVELTAAGRAFLQELELVFEHLQRGVEQARRAGRGEVGRLVVGYHSITLYNIMPSAVRLFRERYPDVEVVLQEMISPALEEALESGAVDVGLAGLSGIGARMLDYEILYRDTVAVALPKGHWLESRTSIPLAALADEPFVMYSRVQKKQGFDQIIALCQSRGFSPHIVQEAATEAAVISLVAGGIGIAIVVHSLERVRAEEVSYRTLVEPLVEGNYGVVWKRQNPSPIVQAFVQTVHNIAHNDVVGS